MIKCVGYLRVSGAGQVKGHGFKRQREEIATYAERNGYEVVTWYEEVYTGTEEDRPQFLQMLEDILSNGVRTIIIECMDRFGRRSMVTEQLLALLIRKGVTMISAMTCQDVTADVQDESDPWKKFIVQIMNNIAELDKRLLVRKLKKAREAKKAETGHCEGNKPYGHYPGETETIERMKQLYRKKPGEERLTSHAIAMVLNREERKTRSDGEWRSSQVKRILKRLGILK